MFKENFVIDKQGHKNAVLFPMKDWEQIKKDLEELERLRNKKKILLNWPKPLMR